MNWFGFAAYYKFRIGFQIQPKKIIETRDMAEVKINKKKSYLHKNSAISVSMGINSPCGSLATDGTGESHQHPSPRGFCEERPRESGDVPRPRFAIPTNCRNRGAFHP